MTTEISIHDLQMRALKATKACPDCVPHPSETVCVCPSCGTTGIARILDPPIREYPSGEFELRVECVCKAISEKGVAHPDCPSCQSRGYTPNPDGFAWIRAALVWTGGLGSITFRTWTKGRVACSFWRGYGDVIDVTGDTLEEALTGAIAQAVEAQAKAGE